MLEDANVAAEVPPQHATQLRNVFPTFFGSVEGAYGLDAALASARRRTRLREMAKPMAANPRMAKTWYSLKELVKDAIVENISKQ